MGVSLLGRNGDQVHMNNTCWSVICGLAESYGWIAAGTEPPDGWPSGLAWHARYECHDLQWVTDTDARYLGEALQRAGRPTETCAPWKIAFQRQVIGPVIMLCQQGGFRIC